MLIPNHPDDERLSALASGDTDATADASLTDHVSACVRCTDLVDELGALRASLAELPDLRPSRPLRLLPPVEAAAPARVDRIGGWARRFFAPVLTAGAALAMVGLVGTAAPAIQSAATGAGDAANFELAQPAASEAPAQGGGEGAPAAESSAGAAEEPVEAEDAVESAEALVDETIAERSAGTDGSAAVDDPQDDDAATTLPAERSPWPMVLFTGVALMVAAGLLRWILAPRPG